MTDNITNDIHNALRDCSTEKKLACNFEGKAINNGGAYRFCRGTLFSNFHTFSLVSYD